MTARKKSSAIATRSSTDTATIATAMKDMITTMCIAAQAIVAILMIAAITKKVIAMDAAVVILAILAMRMRKIPGLSSAVSSLLPSSC